MTVVLASSVTYVQYDAAVHCVYIELYSAIPSWQLLMAHIVAVYNTSLSKARAGGS
jgi:hypothetical protein